MQEKIKEIQRIIQKDHGNITGLMVVKDGKTVLETYRGGCTADSRVHVYSVTKSILSLLFGIAMDKGCIRGTDRKLLEFFPDYPVKSGREAIRDITLENLLTMTAPYNYEPGPDLYTAYFTSRDWVRFTLDRLGDKGRIGDFFYTPLVGPDLLCGVLTKATGQSVLDFAAEHLFSPLGITVKGPVTFSSAEEQFAFSASTCISGWVADEAGTNSGGWGLTLSVRDMAKIGRLCMDGGRWEGRQIVSRSFMKEGFREHSRWTEMNLSYGYLWWLVDPAQGAFAAMGDGGNVIYCNPEKKLVVAIGALFEQDVKDRLELIREHIEPIFAP